MSLPPYPRNPGLDSFFAHKFVRVLGKSCAAQEIGSAACYLLCLIAHTEDAAHYRGPVTFWNSQLMMLMDFKCHKQLDRARAAAIKYGWLHYHRDGDRRPGRYFVAIPPRFANMSDSPIEDVVLEEGPGTLDEPDVGLEVGREEGPGTPRITPETQNGHSSRATRGTISPTSVPLPAPPSTLSLTQDPKEEGSAASGFSSWTEDDDFQKAWSSWKTSRQQAGCELSQGEKNAAGARFEQLGKARSMAMIEYSLKEKLAALAESPLAKLLADGDFQTTWELWQKFRIEKKKPLTPTMVIQQQKLMARIGKERAIAGLEYTMAMGWQGFKEPPEELVPKKKASAVPTAEDLANWNPIDGGPGVTGYGR